MIRAYFKIIMNESVRPHELKSPDNVKQHRFSWDKKGKLMNLV